MVSLAIRCGGAVYHITIIPKQSSFTIEILLHPTRSVFRNVAPAALLIVAFASDSRAPLFNRPRHVPSRHTRGGSAKYAVTTRANFTRPKNARNCISAPSTPLPPMPSTNATTTTTTITDGSLVVSSSVLISLRPQAHRTHRRENSQPPLLSPPPTAKTWG
jgi:hypothetical protein